MNQTLLEMAKELTTEMIRQYQVPPDQVQSLLQDTYATLQRLYQAEMSNEGTASTQTPETDTRAAWKASISNHAVICLECGASFKQLSARHLRHHELDPWSYRIKYGIPRTQALSARRVTTRRRELAKQIRPWEQVANRRRKQPRKDRDTK